MSALEQEKQKRPRGNPNLRKGGPPLNPKGRPKDSERDLEKSNKTLRQKEFIDLLRKIRPHVSKAVNAAVEVLESDKENGQTKLRASVILIETYKSVLKEAYDQKYDEDTVEEEDQLEDDNSPVFSLTVINNDKEG